jgi:hypothetical protein
MSQANPHNVMDVAHFSQAIFSGNRLWRFFLWQKFSGRCLRQFFLSGDNSPADV